MSTPPVTGWTAEYDEHARKAGRASWAAWVAEVEQQLGRSICGRRTGKKAKRPGVPCQHAEGAGARHIRGAVGPCKHHGGLNPAGEASHQFVHGRHVRSPVVVGPSLRARVESFIDFEPRRMLQVGGAILMARIEDLLDRLGAAGVGPETAQRVRELLSEVKDSTPEKRIVEVLIEARNAIEDETNADQLWRELYEVVDLARAAADTYRKVLSESGEMVPRSSALLLFDQLGRDVVSLIDDLPLSDAQKKLARLRLAGTIAGYVHRRVLPVRAVAAIEVGTEGG